MRLASGSTKEVVKIRGMPADQMHTEGQACTAGRIGGEVATGADYAFASNRQSLHLTRRSRPKLHVMDFQLSEQAQAARSLARDFADRVLRPNADRYREQQGLPHDIVDEMAQSGILGGTIPERWGGSGMTHESLVAMVEELSTVDHVMAGEASQASAVLGSGILHFGSDDHRERYLRPLCSGQRHGAVAMTEPQGGSDAAGMVMRAEQVGNGYVLRGQKTFVSHIADADFLLTFAQVDPEMGRDGICAFLVDRDSPGIEVLPIDDVGVMRPHSWGQVFFDAVRIEGSQRLGGVGDGLRVALSALELGRMCIAARAVGAARQCLAAAAGYASRREVGGLIIGKHQHVQRRLADMLVDVNAARLLTYQVAFVKDSIDDQARADAAVAKIFATNMLERVASHTIEIFGGYGLTTDYPWVQYLKDAKAMQIAEGTQEVQYGLIGESILGFRRPAANVSLRLMDVGRDVEG